jgi:hypothetical protein
MDEAAASMATVRFSNSFSFFLFLVFSRSHLSFSSFVLQQFLFFFYLGRGGKGAGWVRLSDWMGEAMGDLVVSCGLGLRNSSWLGFVALGDDKLQVWMMSLWNWLWWFVFNGCKERNGGCGIEARLNWVLF